MAEVLRSRGYFLQFVVVSALITLLYLILLPSLPLGSVRLNALSFATPVQIVFSVLFGVLLSAVVTLDIYSIRSNLAGERALTIGSVLATLVNGLCCTPVVPSVLAIFSNSPEFLFTYSPAVQSFFERSYLLFYTLSAVLLLIAVRTLSKNVACCRVAAG